VTLYNVRRVRRQPTAFYRPIQTGASRAIGLVGSAAGASPLPAFHTRTKSLAGRVVNLLSPADGSRGGWTVGLDHDAAVLDDVDSGQRD